MIADFEQILEPIVNGLDPIRVYTDPQDQAHLDKPVKFYWGRSNDVANFLTTYGEQHFPLVWSVVGEDEIVAPGLWQRRNAEIVLATRETRKDLLNPDRLDAAFGIVLWPLWEAVAAAISKNAQMDIVPETERFTKFPNYQVITQEGGNSDIWDCLRVRFTATFNNSYNC